MDDRVKQIFKNMIKLAKKVTKATDKASFLKKKCSKLKFKTKKLTTLLQQAARACSDTHHHPTHLIIEETEQVLYKALSLVLRCCANTLMKRVFTKLQVAAFRKVSYSLQNSISYFSWLRDDGYLRLIRKQIAILHNGSPEDRSDAATSLVSLARGNDHYRKLVIEKGGVSPLLKLLKEGKMEGQANAARAIGLLGRDPDSVEHMIHLGVCSVFANILEEGPIKLQVVVAWAVSVLAANYPKCQDLFAQNNTIRFLVDHLAFETIEEDRKYEFVNRKPTSIVPSNSDHETKARMNQMTTLALWLLAKGNSSNCRTIAESEALLCFVVFLEIGPRALQYNSAMAVMEITAVTQQDADLRESAFNPNSPVCEAVVDQMLKIIVKARSKHLIPCIKTIGNLAMAARETRIIPPLVRLLGKREIRVKVRREALIALTKYACTENDFHMDNSKAIIRAGGTKRLVRLVFSGEHMVGIPALLLLSYIVLHLPHMQELAQADVLRVLEWASKQSSMTQDEVVHELLLESIGRFQFCRFRDPRRFHKSRILPRK